MERGRDGGTAETARPEPGSGESAATAGAGRHVEAEGRQNAGRAPRVGRGAEARSAGIERLDDADQLVSRAEGPGEGDSSGPGICGPTAEIGAHAGVSRKYAHDAGQVEPGADGAKCLSRCRSEFRAGITFAGATGRGGGQMG